MFKALTPIFALIVAVGLALTYVRPTFLEIKGVESETRDYSDAIEKAEQLHSLINEKVARLQSFDPHALENLEAMVPDEIDEVSVIMDLDSLARSNNMLLSDIQVAKEKGAPAHTGQTSPEPADPALITAETSAVHKDVPGYTSTDISFTVTGVYEDMRNFVESLEKSLVLVDVTKLTFSSGEGDLTSYQMTVRTYALSIKQ